MTTFASTQDGVASNVTTEAKTIQVGRTRAYGIHYVGTATAGTIELKDGRILGTFVIKKALEKIIHNEDKQSPFSDDILVNKLDQEGYTLARRTVAKYRDQMGYPVARLRKEI